ncbi:MULTISPECIES: TAXI family TRAP transporter solute-binding subunit [Roseobacteraceae]|uniref:TAXI family TRAP transporter solute-binding subunit n=1 Tax=Roseobacteraceae TaxID=2854170 RepID=UPI0007C3F3B4|nr:MULTISPECIES: TAXI family TRAP transporter solute-binding subunit [unclassified Sulfitobacter]KZX94084.1 C4-dicarboxylate ABC transporter substrate-binding protein [Sulfitobacter sp. HI0023]KZY25970.1 C4-dicarboxylate ABC transporter substrate-binding protein [Sulfitobacter sp. HI0040]KZY50300.1 C4-dicarboxylate ABC transporter substrate-binding protein [Sulfitobacter sp. HI0054]KZZ66561.1 C4-dicarboxylate ABC transporter substrate-binding protein [Sulfitobacter sp. HI0129]
MKRRNLIGLSLVAVLAGTTAFAQDADRSNWPGNIVVATASPGGTYAIYGQGVASVISSALGVPASTQQTQGPLQNLVLVNKQRVDVGLTTLGPAFEAIQGEMDMDLGTKYDGVRALFPMYVTPFQAAALARSGIVKVSDFDGKTIGTGPKGGTGGTYWERWFEALGLNVNVQNGPIGDQTSQLADGRLDAVATAAGLPMSAFSELEALQPSVIFGLNDDEIAKLQESVPYAQIMEIPAATYSSLDEPVKTFGMWNIAFASKDMPESLAYEITKAIFENHDALLATHGSAKETLLENVAMNTVMPYHPGAIRYFEENGIEVPYAVRPAE